MLTARDLINFIIETALETEGVGELEESVKWGQPSFTPKKPNIGSSIRIQTNKDDTLSLMFICTTGLVDEFRSLYGDRLILKGNREIHLRADDLDKNRDALKHCISLALTNKVRKK